MTSEHTRLQEITSQLMELALELEGYELTPAGVVKNLDEAVVILEREGFA